MVRCWAKNTHTPQSPQQGNLHYFCQVENHLGGVRREIKSELLTA